MGIRVRRLREQRGWSVREFAKRADISASYVSLIENGHKIPTPEVARRIAEVLEDDQRLYQAWAQAVRSRKLEEARQALANFETALRTPYLDARVVDAESIRWEAVPEAALVGKLRRWKQRLSGKKTSQPRKKGEIPVVDAAPGKILGLMERSSNVEYAMAALSELEMVPTMAAGEGAGFLGAVPESGAGEIFSLRQAAQRAWQKQEPVIRFALIPELMSPNDPDCLVLGTYSIDIRSLPDPKDERLLLPYAYQLSERGIFHVHNTLQAGDITIISQERESDSPDQIFAIENEVESSVELRPILKKSGSVILLSSRGQAHVDVLPPEGERRILGRIALAIRATGYAAFTPRVKPK